MDYLGLSALVTFVLLVLAIKAKPRQDAPQDHEHVPADYEGTAP